CLFCSRRPLVSPLFPYTTLFRSWGGFVAWAFAISHPDKLEKLVIINAPHPAVFARLLTSDPAQQKASEYMEIFRSAQAELILSADRKSTRLNSSHGSISYAVFCL